MENRLSHEQQFDLQMELNHTIEYIDELNTEQRVLDKKFYEAYVARDALMKELGIRGWDVT